MRGLLPELGARTVMLVGRSRALGFALVDLSELGLFVLYLLAWPNNLAGVPGEVCC